MDRSDEIRDHSSADTSHDSDEHIEREGDILGLGGSPVPKAPGDPTTEYDADSVRKRRERALGGDEVRRAPDDQHGATGVDMGAGGHGTDVSGE